jgi:hypothetical protein
MTFCLMPDKVAEFRRALKQKDIKIADLLNTDTATRTELLRKYAGDNAPDVNRLFEQKLVLKNKELGIRNWASKIGEIGRYSPKGKVELLKKINDFKEQQRERIFSPKEEETFLNDLADSKIGAHITREEAAQIFDLTNRTEELKGKFDEQSGQWESPQAKAEYGASKVVLERYVEGLKNEKLSVLQMLQKRYGEAKTTWGENRVKAGTDILRDAAKAITDNSISFVASIDNSFLGRQGLNTLLTHPSIWFDMAKRSFSDIYTSLKSKHGGDVVKDAVMADAYSRPNYMNGNYDLAKLIPKSEEQYPTTLPERIPVLGRAFKASEAAFTNSAIRARINTFDLLHEVAKRNGVDVADPVQIEGMGKLINSVTARGDIGRLGDGGLIRVVMWAPKMLKGNWDVLTAHTGGAGLETPFARQQARINLLKIVSSTAAVAALANALSPGSVELDPRSSDFMKIRVGNTRFDITGGKASIVTLLSRAITMSSKSTRTGKVTPLNSGKYGSKTVFDVGIDFLVNKTTPAAKAAITIAKGRDFKGQKPTAGSIAFDLTTPISVQNFVENFYGPDADGSAAAVVGSIVDLVGINANTYSQPYKRR